VGVAHGIGKKVIPLTKKKESIPSDLQNERHIIYGGDIDKLKTELSELLLYDGLAADLGFVHQ
jgi:hypothetical protein